MPISLSGMASGLDTESIISQLMAIEQNKVTAVQRRQIVRHAAQGRPHGDQDQARRGQDRGDRSQHRRHLEARADHDVVGSDQGRRHDARGRRHRRPLDPGRQARLLRAARLRLPREHATPARSISSTARTRRARHQQGLDRDPGERHGDRRRHADQRQRGRARVRRGGQGRRDRAPRLLRPQDRRAAPTSRVDSSAFSTGGAAAHRGHQRTRAPSRRTLNASYRLDDDPVAKSSESNVIESAIPGVRLTLKGVSASPVSVNTTQPDDRRRRDHEEDHRARRRLQRRRHGDARRADREGDPDGHDQPDLQKGQLFGDSGMTSMLSGLKSSMTQVVTRPRPHGPGRPRHRRPEVHRRRRHEDAKAGKLTFDSTKLTAALAADYTKVRDLFAGVGAIKGLSDARSPTTSVRRPAPTASSRAG